MLHGLRKVVAKAQKGSNLCLCISVLSNWLQKELLSWLLSIVFDRLYCSILSICGLVPHRHKPSTELILLRDPIRQITTYIIVQLHADSCTHLQLSHVCIIINM